MNSLKRHTLLQITTFCLAAFCNSAIAPCAAGLDASPKIETSHLEKGFEYLSEMHLDKAIASFAELLANNSKFANAPDQRKASAQLYALIGEALQFDENEEPAEQCFYIATLLDPTNKLYRAYRADCLNRLFKIPEAERIIEKLEPKPGDSLKIYEISAIPEMRRMNYAKARGFIEKGLATSGGGSDRARSYVFLARISLKEGKPLIASDYYAKAAESTKSPYMAKILSALGKLCAEKRSEARVLYKEAGQINADDPGWLYGMSITTDKASPKNEDLHSIEKAAECPRFSVIILNKLAWYLDGRKQTQQAQECLDYILKVRPWSNDPHLTKGIFYRKARNFASAEKEFRTCLTANPWSPPAYTELASMYIDNGKRDDAIKMYEEGSKYCPTSAIYLPYGMLMLSSSSYDKAESLFTKAIAREVNPDQGNLLVKNDFAKECAGLGTCLYKKNDLSGALAQAKQFNKYKFVPTLGVLLTLIKLRPSRIDFEGLGSDRTPELIAAEHVALADMLFETRHIPDCVKEYRLAIASNPSDVDLHSYMMTALSEQNDWIGTVKEDLDLSRQIVNRVPTQVDKMIKSFQHKNSN